MKKLVLLFAAIVIALNANAQFEKGKTYVGGTLTGLGLNYSKDQKWTFGLGAMGGYFLKDNLMINGNIDVFLQSGNNSVAVGPGIRYYFSKCGVYVGGFVNYVHQAPNINDVMPQVEAGYAFFVSRIVTIEPAIFYRQSFKSMDYTKFGLRVGIGLNFETNKKNQTIFNKDYQVIQNM